MTHDHPEAVEYARAAPDLEAAAGEFMAAIIVRCITENGSFRCPGLVVPSTEGTLAIHEGAAGAWCITHLPTGLSIGRASLTLMSRAEAARIAKRIFVETRKLGCNFHSTDPHEASGPIRALTDDQKKFFWEVVKS